MAERRMLSKTISTSRKVNRLTDRAALLYTWLLPHTDDYGHLEGDALSIKAKVVPMRSNTEGDIDTDLDTMAQLGLIIRYEIEGEKYIEIVAFDEFQTFRSDRPRRALYPAPNGQYPKENQGSQSLVYQGDTNDIPMGDNRQRKLSEDKISKGKVTKGKGVQGEESENEYPADFEALWKTYPRKTGKGAALKAWKALKPTRVINDRIAASVEAYKKTKQWTKDDGQFIPHFATFLNQRRFDDEPTEAGRSMTPGKFGNVGRTVEN